MAGNVGEGEGMSWKEQERRGDYVLQLFLQKQLFGTKKTKMEVIF
jgi:hypothetical protein